MVNILLKLFTHLRCRLGTIVLPKFVPTYLAMLRTSLLLSNITRACTTLTVSSAMAARFGRPDRPSSSTLSFPPAAHFLLCYRRRILPKCFHEVFMIFLGRYFFLTEVIDNRSDFKFLHFANVSHPPPLKAICICNLS